MARSLPSAVAHALKLADDGADILDIGGESTRPGAEPVPLTEELRRTIPVIEQVRARCALPISIDTYRAEVARQALSAGATIVNDISGLTFDPQMTDVCADSNCGVICMHIQGTPQTMQIDPRYDDVVRKKSNLTSGIGSRRWPSAASTLSGSSSIRDRVWKDR